MHEQILTAREAGRQVTLHLDTKALLVETRHMSLREIGEEWLNLLHGRPSLLEFGVVKVSSRAPRRPNGATWERTRRRIFERDGYRCQYCGSTEQLECDHVVPRARGGTDYDDNLTTACAPCNRAKGALLVEEWRA